MAIWASYLFLFFFFHLLLLDFFSLVVYFCFVTAWSDIEL